MESLDLVERFRQLSTRERAELLPRIVDELTPYEWRVITKTLNKRSFQFDIVTSLPFEIVIKIFKYLDIATPFRLQRVSKKWQSVLSSVELLRPLLKRWYTEYDRPLEGEALLQGDEYAICQLKAEHQWRFQTGSLFSSVTCKGVYHWSSALCGDHVAWLDSSQTSSALKVCNLRTGNTFVFRGEAREALLDICMSDELVASRTHGGTFYAFSLATGERRSFRVPVYMTHHVVCRGKTIIGTGFNNDGIISVFNWDFNSRRCRSFPVTPRGTDPSHLIENGPVLLVPNSDTIILLAAHSEELEGKIHILEYSFNGERGHSIQICCGGGCSVRASWVRYDGNGHTIAHAQFDKGTRHERVKSMWFDYDQQGQVVVFEHESIVPPVNHFWKQILYQREQDPSDEVDIIKCLGSRETPCDRVLDFAYPRREAEEHHFPPQLHFNENFVAFFHAEYLHVGCFDKDIRLPQATIEELMAKQ